MLLDGVCEFLGYRTDVDLFEKINNICFSASLREGLPVNIIEGMACGKVCICSTNRGHNALIIDNLNGLLFSPKNPNQMISAVLSVYNDKELYNRLANQAELDSKQYAVEYAVDFMKKNYTDLA